MAEVQPIWESIEAPPKLGVPETTLDASFASAELANEDAAASGVAAEVAEESLGSDASTQATSLLPSEWASSVKSRREVPKAAKVAALGVALLLLFVFAMPGRDSSATITSTMIADSEVEGAEFLKKRRHLTDEDFRTPNSYVAAPQAVAPVEVAVAPSISVEERQRLRANNPEDLRGASKTTRTRSLRAKTAPTSSPNPVDEDNMLVFFNPVGARSSGATTARASLGERVLVPAASTVGIQLERDIVIRRGRTTVTATVGGHELLPKGTKLLGSASATADGFVSIRFREAVLPSGQSVSVRAEAIDRSTGSQHLAGSVEGGAQASESSAARNVGRDAAGRAVMSVLGNGFVGSTMQQTMSETDRSRRRQRTPLVVSLSKNSTLDALFLRAVDSQ